jgi:hypothetical protein
MAEASRSGPDRPLFPFAADKQWHGDDDKWEQTRAKSESICDVCARESTFFGAARRGGISFMRGIGAICGLLIVVFFFLMPNASQ